MSNAGKGHAADGKALVEALLHGREVGKIGDAGAAAIASSAAAEKLQSLSLTFAGLGPKGAQALAGSAHLGALTELDLEGNDIGDEGAEALAASGAMPRLRILKLGHSGFGERGHAACNSIGPRGAAALARSKALAKLDQLGLPLYEIDADLAAALVDSPLARFLYLAPSGADGARASPDGAWEAKVSSPTEVWPDGPRAGTLQLGKLRVDDCGPSVIFSHDSRSLAATQWLKTKGAFSGKCQLVVLHVADGKQTRVPGEHGPLALYAFDGKTVRAFDPLEAERSELAISVLGH